MDREFIVRAKPRNASDEPRTFKGFLATVGITLAIGIGLSVMAIRYFRARKEIITVPEIVTKTVTQPKTVIKEVIKEVVKEMPVPVLAPAPAPPVVEMPERQRWEGIWHLKHTQLPMFKLKNAGGTATGVYAPNAGSILPFQGGKVVGDAIELVVDDSLFRVHFRLKMLDSQSMGVEAWITDEDWLISLARGNKMVRTRQQALVVRAQLAENIRLTRKVVSLGIFCRGSEN